MISDVERIGVIVGTVGRGMGNGQAADRGHIRT